MNRTLLSIVFFLVCSAGQVSAQTPIPLDRILLDLDGAPLSVAQKIAERQAHMQWQIDKGPLYKSAPKRRNGNPNEITDDKYFEGLFCPMSTQTRLAIFSDDGCDVWIDNVLVLNNFKKGQHLPDVRKQSFHVLTKFKPVPGRIYDIRIHYSNTIYNGKTDIDGCTLFAYAGEGKPGGVEIVGVQGMGAQKFVIATLPPKLERTNKWSAKLTIKGNFSAELKYRRAKAAPVLIPGKGASAVKFVNGVLNHEIQLVDGPGNAPELAVAKGVVTIQGVEQGDVIIIEAPKIGKDSVATVKNFTWNDLQRNGNLVMHKDWEKLSKDLKTNVIDTIRFSLDPGKNSAQSKQRMAIEKVDAKRFPKDKLASLAIPSAMGIGEFPADFGHGHLASLAIPPLRLRVMVNEANDQRKKELRRLEITNDTGFEKPEDRRKQTQYYNATFISLRDILIEGSKTKSPHVIYHTYEFVDYQGVKLMPGDPIRNLRTNFGANPMLFQPPDPKSADSWRLMKGEEDVDQFEFFIRKDRKVVIYVSANGGKAPLRGSSTGRALMVLDALDENED